MKILHVIDSLQVGGAERVLIDLCNLLNRHKVKVDVLVLTKREEMKEYLDPAIGYTNLQRQFKFNPVKLYQLNRICRSYDIVHVHLRYNLKYVGVSKLLFGGDFRLILHDHFGDIDRDKHIPFGIGYFIKRNWYAGVHRSLVDWAVERVGLGSSKAFHLPNIILKENVQGGKRVKSGNSTSAILVSNFRESKNIFFALDLVEAIVRSGISLHIDVVGKVVEQKYYEELLNVHRAKSLENVVTFRHDVSNVQGILWQYDIALHTAYLESGPLVLIEYLAQELPFLAYQTGEVANQLNSELPEFFLNTFEIKNWVDRFYQFTKSTHPEIRQRMKTCFEEKYSGKAYVEKCVRIYQRILTAQD